MIWGEQLTPELALRGLARQVALLAEEGVSSSHHVRSFIILLWLKSELVVLAAVLLIALASLGPVCR